MSEPEIRIAKRLATYMMEVAEQQVDLNFFQGLGLGLGIVYEETQGRSVNNMKPRELIQWALNLPEKVTFPHVRAN